MRLNELMECTGQFCLWAFGGLRALGNGFNWTIIVVMFIMGVIWVKKMGDFNREARENGTLK